jgi:hypothetical protein
MKLVRHAASFATLAQGKKLLFKDGHRASRLYSRPGNDLAGR